MKNTLSYDEVPITRPKMLFGDTTLLFESISNFVPKINETISHHRRKPNTNYLRQKSDVPIIEIIPPTPSTTEPKLKFCNVAIPSFVEETLDVCIVRLRRLSEPCLEKFLNTKKDDNYQTRRSSMPIISSEKSGFRCRKRNKNRRKQRRHSLPMPYLMDDPLKDTHFNKSQYNSNRKQSVPIIRSYSENELSENVQGSQFFVNSPSGHGKIFKQYGINGKTLAELRSDITFEEDIVNRKLQQRGCSNHRNNKLHSSVNQDANRNISSDQLFGNTVARKLCNKNSGNCIVKIGSSQDNNIVKTDPYTDVINNEHIESVNTRQSRTFTNDDVIINKASSAIVRNTLTRSQSEIRKRIINSPTKLLNSNNDQRRGSDSTVPQYKGQEKTHKFNIPKQLRTKLKLNLFTSIKTKISL